jgi:protein involved in polysaccharide export with SLBB domain
MWAVRWGAWVGLAVAGLFLAGCHSGGDPRFADVPGLIGQPAGAPAPAPSMADIPGTDPYKLRKMDALTIIFSDLPYSQPAIEDRIREDGTLTLIQNQTFKVEGKTRGELANEIRERYVPKFFKNMTVTVKLTESTRFYYVGGEVKNAGRQVYLSQITLLGAIRSCGDFTDFANKKKVRLTRADGSTSIINCKKAIVDSKLDPEVYPGDKIYVPRSIF